MFGLHRTVHSSTHEHALIHFESSENPHYDFLIPPPSSVHLNRETELTPASFDTPTLYTFSTSSSPSYSGSTEFPPSPDSEPSPDPSLPEFYSRKPATRLRSGNRVPRPRNAFMIFRSEFWAGEKISSSVERDHRHISRIIGHCWNQLSEAEKDVWRRKAEQEKAEHSLRYPGYRFSPTVRAKKPVKRKVKRNGKEELLRCQQVAALILAGKEGVELDTAVKSLSIPVPQSEASACKEEETKPSILIPASHVMDPEPQQWNICSSPEAPAFRSPLLPPGIPTNEISSIRYIEPAPLSNYPESPYHMAGGYMQYPYWNVPSHLESRVPDHEYYIVDANHSNVAQPRIPAIHIASHSTYSQSQIYELGSTANFEYPSTPLSTAACHVTFRNPFECSSTYLPYANQPRPPLDPLHWDLTGFPTFRFN